ncbi:hypothetical protein LZ554_009072 [Drepanopeziza brunnea f. sp. 'monogermtubi']|nr:hypothetical protein LZ554_009072 [Drepanopeziza brunnea f. sp. 'monogermtubi']
MDPATAMFSKKGERRVRKSQTVRSSYTMSTLPYFFTSLVLRSPLYARKTRCLTHDDKEVIRHLQKASVRPNDFTFRYSELLDSLWQRRDSESQTRVSYTPNTDPLQFKDVEQ